MTFSFKKFIKNKIKSVTYQLVITLKTGGCVNKGLLCFKTSRIEKSN